MESARDQCNKEGCPGCRHCSEPYDYDRPVNQTKMQMLGDYSIEQLQAEISKRKLDRKKEAERRIVENEIKDLQKKIYTLQQRLK